MLQVLLFEDVIKQYMLNLYFGEVFVLVLVDMFCLFLVVLFFVEIKFFEVVWFLDEFVFVSKCCSKLQVDMWKYVVMILLDIEQLYVELLCILMQGYMQLLKQLENVVFCDFVLVDEIFDQIFEFLEYYE